MRADKTTSYAAALVLTFSVFALLGLGHRLYDLLVGNFARLFTLDQSQLSLTRGIYSLVYILSAIPMALVARKLGYKAIIGFGLGFVALGAFLLYPASEQHAFGYFLSAAAVMSCGWIAIEVGGNPLVMEFGLPQTAVFRLNLAQSLYPLGAIAGILIGQRLIAGNLVIPAAHTHWAIIHPYILIGVGVAMVALLAIDLRFPLVATLRNAGSVKSEFRSLLGSRRFVFALVAQFFCIVCLCGSWFQTERFFLTSFWEQRAIVGQLFLWAMIAFAAGRIVGTVLMLWVRPERLLAAFCALGAMTVFAAGQLPPAPGIAALIGSSFFLSILWPTITGLAIRGIGPKMKLATALLCIAGSMGGVFFGQLQAFWQPPTLALAAAIPACCYLVVLTYAVSESTAARSDV